MVLKPLAESTWLWLKKAVIFIISILAVSLGGPILKLGLPSDQWLNMNLLGFLGMLVVNRCASTPSM